MQNVKFKALVPKRGENELRCDACDTVANLEKTPFTPTEKGLHWICRVCESEYYIKDED